MKGKDLLLGIGLTLGFIGYNAVRNLPEGTVCNLSRNQSNEITKVDNFGTPVFPPTVLMDTNNDGECDKARSFLMGNRMPHIIYSNPTGEEKELYRMYRRQRK